MWGEAGGPLFIIANSAGKEKFPHAFDRIQYYLRDKDAESL